MSANEIEITDERIDKLPKWAADHIKRLERRVEDAEKARINYADDQTPSPIWHEDYQVCDRDARQRRGGYRSSKIYVQSREICAEYAGVFVRLFCRPDRYDGEESGQIDLSWGSGDQGALDDVVFRPSSFNKAELLSLDNARRR